MYKALQLMLDVNDLQAKFAVPIFVMTIILGAILVGLVVNTYF
jgi:hypothetical protein